MAPKTGRKSTCAGDDAHAVSDAAHFSALIDSLEKVANVCPQRGALSGMSVAEPFAYSDNDLNEFTSLTACAVSPALSRRTRTRHSPGKRDGAGNTGYSASDRQHFDRLMSFAPFSDPKGVQASRHVVQSAGTRETVASCGYSAQDMAAFAALIPAGVSDGDDHSPRGAGTRFNQTDTPTRQIRIIDCDKQREADKRRAGQADTTMKIRYFD